MAKNSDPRIVEYVETNLAKKKETLAAANKIFSLLEQLKRNPTPEMATKIIEDLREANETLRSFVLLPLSEIAYTTKSNNLIQQYKKDITNIYDQLVANNPGYEFEITEGPSGVYLRATGNVLVTTGSIFKKTKTEKRSIFLLSALVDYGYTIAVYDTDNKRGTLIEQLKGILTKKNINFKVK